MVQTQQERHGSDTALHASSRSGLWSLGQRSASLSTLMALDPLPVGSSDKLTHVPLLVLLLVDHPHPVLGVIKDGSDHLYTRRVAGGNV